MTTQAFPDAIRVIRERRSVRRFSDAPVPESVLEALIDCATCAPSGNNRQPWRFVVLDEPSVLAASAKIIPAGKMLLRSRQAIAVCIEFDDEILRRYSWLDASAAVENLLLAAHAHGIGAVWLGVAPRPERIDAMGTLLGLPPSTEVMAVVALGYPGEAAVRARAPRPAVIWHNRWGSPLRAADAVHAGGAAARSTTRKRQE